MKLSAKLMLGFGSVLGLLLILAVISFWALNNSSDGFTQYRGLATDTNLSGRLQANMLMVRMQVKDFILTGSEDDLKRYHDYYAKMREFLDEAISEIKQPERAGLIAKIDEGVMDYGKYFEKVKEFRVERNRYVDDALNVNGPLMEQKLNRILQTAERDNDLTAAVLSGQAMRNLLLARLYVMKFLDDNTQDSVDRVYSESKNFNTVLDDLERSLQNPERRRLLNEVADLEEKYMSAFGSLAKVIFARNDVVESHLDKLGPTIANNVEEVKLSVMADQNILGPKLQAANNQAITMAVGISLVAFAVGIVTAGFIIRTVNRQLGSDPAEIANVAQSIAGGNLDFKFC